MDGTKSLTVATSVGIVHLSRQVLSDEEAKAAGEQVHWIPGNQVLPEHHGMVITRRLQEWACLLSVDIGFPTAQRLLGWRTQEPKIVCQTEMRRLVQRHGKVLREAAVAEVEALKARPDLEQLAARLEPSEAPRRAAAWPAAMTAAVAAAVAAENPEPPEGVSAPDWERVLTRCREEGAALDLDQLARLGPEIKPGQVVAAADEVLVRTPKKKGFAQLHTARVATTSGYRYLVGAGPWFWGQLYLLIVLCGGRRGLVTFLADGGQQLRAFFREQLQGLPRAEFVLDWYHLVKKCRDRISRMGGSKEAKRTLRKAVLNALWQGNLAEALQHLEKFRDTASNLEALEELQGYLRAREEMLVEYRQCRLERRYIGSGWAEKGNDLMVARRQKRQGMHWSEDTSESLALLKCLQLNHEWDAYWVHGRLPSLVAT